MSDTPRTEKAREQYWMDVYEPNPAGFVVAEPVHSSFARMLERENAELRKDKARLDWLLSKAYFIQLKEGGMLTSRQAIDEAIEEELREKEAGNHI